MVMNMKERNQKKGIVEKRFVTEAYLDIRLDGVKEEMRAQTAEILQGVDKILIRFDTAEKDHAAHGMLHRRITDDLHDHDVRIKKLEAQTA